MRSLRKPAHSDETSGPICLMPCLEEREGIHDAR